MWKDEPLRHGAKFTKVLGSETMVSVEYCWGGVIMSNAGLEKLALRKARSR